MAYIRRETIKATLTFFAVVFVSFLALFVLRSRIESAVTRIDVLRQQLAAREVNTKTLVGLHDEYESTIKNYLAILGNHVPRRDDLASVIRELELEAARSEVNVVLAVVSEELPTGDQFGYVSYSVSARGEAAAVRDYFDRLSKYRFLNSRGSLLVSEDEKGADISTVLRVYYRSF